MNDIDFERRLEAALAGYADRPVESGVAWRRFTERRRQAAVGRARRLVTATAAGAVAVAAVAVPYALRPGGSERPSTTAGSEHGLAIRARIGIPGRGHGPGDSDIVDAVGGLRGQVWVMTYGGTLARIDPRSDRVMLRRHLAGLTALTAGAGAVWALLAVKRPHIKSQLVKLNPVTGRKIASTNLIPHCGTISFGGGELWAACGHGSGTDFVRFDPSSLALLTHGGPAYGVSAIAATAHGIWYAGKSGVSGFVGRFKLTWVNSSDPADLADTDSLVYADRSLWAFDGGENVARVNPATGRITKVYSAARYDPTGDLSLNFLAVDRNSIWFLRDASYRATAVLRVSLATGRPVGQVSGVGSCGEPCWQIYVTQGSAWVPTQTNLARISPGRVSG
ncbi:MAG TPA: hypothetical protein VGM14_19285 [Streptosporangiaceae bacterium]|jgi:hypothetical protein